MILRMQQTSTLSLHNSNILDSESAVFTKIARLLVYIAIICLPYSHAFVNQFMIAATVFAILSGNWRRKWRILQSYTPIWISIALIGLLAITLLHPHVPWNSAATSFFKYTKILYIPILLPLFLKSSSRQTAIHCFVSAMVTGAILSCFLHGLFIYSDVAHHPWLKHVNISGSFVNIIDFSVLSAYAIYLLLARCIHEKQNWLLNLSLATVLCLHLFFVNGEKTGTILFFMLMGLLLWQHLRWQGVIIALIAIPLIFIPNYLFASTFRAKANEFLNYFYSVATHAQTSQTSTAYRVDFVKYSYKIFKENPLIGVGIGGFKEAYLKVKGPLLQGSQFLGEPHNSYLYILVETGLIGLSLYLLWLSSLWMFSSRLLKPERYFLQALLLSLIFNGLTNTSITSNTTGTLYIIFIAVLFAAQAPRIVKI